MIALLLPLLFPSADDLADRVDRALVRWDRADSPGGAVAVVRGDEVVLLKTFGAVSGQPMAESTPLYLASLAKPFTAACALHAAAAGDLDLDAPLTKTFPELPEAYGAATLRRCLDHRSGVTDVYDLAVMADLGRAPVASNAAAMELLSRVTELSVTPGERFLYSNSGYVLLAEAVRRGTGRDLADYAREHVFGPLGMEHAGYGTTDLPTGLTGPGGMAASIGDLIAFARALHAGTWSDVLQAEPARPRHPNIGGYASGWMHQRLHGQEVRRHFGGAFGRSSDLIHVPALGLTVIALSNAPDLTAFELAPTLLSWVVPETEADAELEAEAGAEPTVTTGEPRQVAGLWITPDSSRVLVLLPGGHGLRLVGLGDVKVDLAPVGDGRWRGVDVQAPFAVGLEEESLRVEEDGAVTLLQRVPTDARPSADELVGHYVNADLEAEVSFAPGPRGSLVLDQHDALIDLPPFMPMANELFLCDKGAVLVLERDGSGAVVGFVAHVNRAWGVPFERVD